MIQLNLLPPKVREAELLRKILIVAAVAYAIGGAWVAWQWTLNEAKVKLAQRAVERVQAQLNSPELQVAVQAVQKFADDMAAVKAKASVVNEYRKQQVSLLRLLDAVPDWTMNGQVWFLILSAPVSPSRGPAGRTVELTGATLSRSFFVKYFDFMQGQPLVNNLSLDSPPAAVFIHNTQVVQFRLGFTVPDLP
ncbi:MAG TPA: hypothetical protein VK914_03085 [bacterium]|jgi:hypothetical protein|nr:hypothetical protein [bacterium]